jgi:hypothetical protein
MTHATPYQSFPNSFKRDLLAGKRLIGCWSSLASYITTEVLGVAGFDWILLDGEHSPNDMGTYIPQMMALKDSASAPVVRPSWNNPVEIKRLLDAGFYNFLVPFVESVDEARKAVAATRYPPQGMRGSPPRVTLPHWTGSTACLLAPPTWPPGWVTWATPTTRRCRPPLPTFLPQPKPPASPAAFWRRWKRMRAVTWRRVPPSSGSAVTWVCFAPAHKPCVTNTAIDAHPAVIPDLRSLPRATTRGDPCSPGHGLRMLKPRTPDQARGRL